MVGPWSVVYAARIYVAVCGQLLATTCRRPDLRRLAIECHPSSPRKKRRLMSSILILNAGANYRAAYRTHDAKYYDLPIQELVGRRLDRFSVIVVPAWSDQSLLARFAPHLTRFISRGGVLTAFGCHGMRWFDFLDWNDGMNQSVNLTQDGHSAGMFDQVDLGYARWHPSFVAHGFFTLKNQRTTVFAVDEHKRPIAVAVEHGDGVGFFTTLDPDFHFVTGSFIAKDAEQRKTAAAALLRGVMKWAVEEFEARHTRWRRIRRRVHGALSYPSLLNLAYPSLFMIIVIATSVVLVKDVSARSPVVILSTLLGAAGLLVTIAQMIRRRQMKTNSE